ncbi:hypothetical protein ACFL2H_10950 [Planctomycetota bacterium]
MRSTGLLQTLYATASITAAKVLLQPLSQGFTHGRPPRATLVAKAFPRPDSSSRWSAVNAHTRVFSCDAYRVLAEMAYAHEPFHQHPLAASLGESRIRVPKA